MVVRVSIKQVALGINAATSSHERIVALNFGSQIVVGGGGSTTLYWSDIKGKPTFAAVATTGSYSDLADVPSFAEVATTGSYGDLSGIPTDSEGYGRARTLFNQNISDSDIAVWVGSSDEYDALESIDSSTLYFIV